MSNQIYGDLETFESADSGTYGFGSIISNENIQIRGTGSVSTTTTITSSQTANRHLVLPNTASISDSVISATSTDSLTNKTITDTSNNVYCDAFKTNGGGAVIISGATPTGAGQVLTTTASDTAIWATPGSTTASDALPLAGGTMLGDINMDNNRILNIPAVPTASDDAVSKTYVLGVIPFSDVALVISDTAQNTSDISTNLVLIQSNDSDIASLVSDTAQNTSDIATNVSDIASLVSDTAQNTSDIAAITVPTFVDWTSFTPTIGDGLSTPFTINAAQYSRNGNTVNIMLDLVITKDTTSDTALLNGLPLAIGSFGTGNQIANPFYIFDNSDNTVSFGRFLLNQSSSTTIELNVNDFEDNHGYRLSGQFFYSTA